MTLSRHSEDALFVLRCDLKRQTGPIETMEHCDVFLLSFYLRFLSLCICLTYLFFSQMPDYSDLLLLLYGYICMYISSGVLIYI